MSTNPSEDYIKLTKTVESFGCFFERICVLSSTPNKNLKKLFEFKKAFYANINSPDSLTSAIEELNESKPKFSKTSYKNSPLLSKTSLSNNIQKSEQQQPESLPRTSFKTKSVSSSQVNEASQTATKASVHEWQPPVSLHSEYVPISNFLARIKAASHTEIAKLFSLSSNYLHARTFNERQNPVFVALCLCYFENMLKSKSKETQDLLFDNIDVKINSAMTLSEIKEDEFYNFLKESLQNPHDLDNLTKFYEHIMRNSSVYQSGINAFKTIFTQRFPRNPQDLTPSESLDWLNDLENLDIDTLQDVAKLFNTSMRFLVLTKSKLIDHTVSYEKNSASLSNSPRDLPENTIFYDHINNNIYILYQTETQLEESPKDSLLEKTKLTKYSSNPSKPPLDNESLKNIKDTKTHTDFRGGSMPSLDPISSPITSMNELDKHEYPSSYNEIPRLSQGRKLPSLETTNSGLGNQKEFSMTPTHYNLGSATTGRPSFDRMLNLGPQSCPKDAGRFHFRGTELSEDRLTPKEKEPVPTRSNSYNYKEPAVSDEKNTGRFYEREKTDYYRQNSSPTPYDSNRQYLGQRSKETDRESGKMFGLDRAFTQDYSNIGNDSKSKLDYLNPKIYSTNLPWRDSPVNDGSTGSFFKPTGIPSVLKTKFDRVNQNVNQRDLDFDKLIGRYLRKGSSVDRQQSKPANLSSLTNIYNNILGQNKENDRFKPSVGAYLRMDI